MSWSQDIPSGADQFSANSIAAGDFGVGQWKNTAYAGTVYFETISDNTQSRLMIEPTERAVPGQWTVYRIQVRAWSYFDLLLGALFPPGWIQDAGFIFVASPDGAGWNETFVTAPAGEKVALTLSDPVNNYNQAQVSEPKLSILDNGNPPNDLTDKTNNVIVGQQINLQAQFSITNETPTSYQWTVPGYAISNFVVSADISSGTVYSNFVTTNSSVTFYWVDGGAKQVECTATVMGQKMKAKAIFTVIRPSIDFTGIIKSGVAIDQNYVGFTNLLLHFGGIYSNATFLPGIEFDSSNPDMKGWAEGPFDFDCVQIIANKSVVRFDTNGVPHVSNTNGLDNSFPYGPLGNGDGAHQVDSPATEAGVTDTQISLSENFKMVLLFEQSSPAIPIPLREIDWNWTGVAVTNGMGGWTLVSASSYATITTNNLDTTAHPTWTNLVKNISP